MARHIAPRTLSLRLLTPLPALDAARLDNRPLVYRPLTLGLAILERSAGCDGPWRVRLAPRLPLRPLTPSTPEALATRLLKLRDRGVTTRLAATILAPLDMPVLADELPRMVRDRCRPPQTRADFYGWALLYGLGSSLPFGLVDQHDEHRDLPAFYESAGELADRAAFLTARGIANRPLAVITQPSDFDVAADGLPQNRYCTAATWRRACPPGAFLV